MPNMEIFSPYPNMDKLAHSLIHTYQFESSEHWNGTTLKVPESIGEGTIHIYKNQGLQFMRGQWLMKTSGYFSSPDPVGTDDLVDFRIGGSRVINSAYLEGFKRYNWDITQVDGMRFFYPKKAFRDCDITLMKKFQKYLCCPEIAALVSEILTSNPTTFQESIKLEWKFLEFSYYFLDFLNNKDVSRHFCDLSEKHLRAITDVKCFVDQHYEKDIKLESLAKMVGLNIQYLKQGFKKVYNCTIKQYQIKVRMEEARRIVLQEDIPIGEICQRVGYSNRSFFFKVYKKVYGKTPLEDRYANRGDLHLIHLK